MAFSEDGTTKTGNGTKSGEGTCSTCALMGQGATNPPEGVREINGSRIVYSFFVLFKIFTYWSRGSLPFDSKDGREWCG